MVQCVDIEPGNYYETSTVDVINLSGSTPVKQLQYTSQACNLAFSSVSISQGSVFTLPRIEVMTPVSNKP